MIRHLLAVSLAALMSAGPAIALAQSDAAAGAISTYSDTMPKRAKSPSKALSNKTSSHKASTRKASTHKTASKLSRSKATAASAR